MLLEVRPAADSPVPVQRAGAAPPGGRGLRSPIHPLQVMFECLCQKKV